MPVSEPSSSRDRGLNWEPTEGSVTEATRKKGKCQFMVPSGKDNLEEEMEKMFTFYTKQTFLEELLCTQAALVAQW